MSTPYSPYPQEPQEPGQQGGYGQQAPYGSQPPGQWQPYPPPYPQSPYSQGYGQPGYGQPGYGQPYGFNDYLRGAPVGFSDAIRLAFRNTFTYQGRASRSAYWWFALFELIAMIGLGIVGGIIGALTSNGAAASAALGLVFIAAAVVIVLVGLPLNVRRLHDINMSGFWVLIGFVPFVGGIALLVFSLLEGTRGPNRFG